MTSDRRRERWIAVQTWLLRLGGTVEALSFVSLVMPREWMEVSHRWLGMGEMPSGTVVDFMIRQSSLFYGMHGILLWVLSRDVVRHQPVVRFLGWTFLLFGPAFFLIDWTTGTPLWWTICDPLACGLYGAALLYAGTKLDRNGVGTQGQSGGDRVNPA